MNFGRIPWNHDEQAQPPDLRPKPDPPMAKASPKPDPVPSVDSPAFFIERDKAFGPTMDYTVLTNFLKKYKICYPTKSPAIFWTMIYTAVLCGRIGGSGSKERALIWLWHHKHLKLISWSVKTGVYRVLDKSYRLNHKLMIRKPSFHDNRNETCKS